jgi:hypothetical protein
MSDSPEENSGGEGTSTSVVPIKKKKYGQSYKESWEKLAEFRGWLGKSRKGQVYAKCKPCDKDINISSGKDALLKHSISKLHQTKIKSISQTSTLTSFVAQGSANKILEDDIKKGSLFFI